jgi:site-specific recombinase XerD
MSVILRKRKLAKGGFSLWLDYYKEGLRTNETLKAKNGKPLKLTGNKKFDYEVLALAESIREEREKQISNGVSIKVIKRNNNLKEIIYLYLEKFNNSNTLSSAKYLFDVFIEFVGVGANIRNISKEQANDFIEYIQQRKVKNTTINHYITYFNTFFNWCIEKEYISNNPFNHIKKFKKQSTKREYLTIEEIREFSKVDKYHNTKNAFIFSCFTGLRMIDVKNLQWKDIRGNVIYKKIQKTGNYETIPINETAMKILNDRNKDNDFIFDLPKQRRTIEYQLKAICKIAGIEKHITYHCSRHTFATILLSNGVDIYTTSKLLGHSSVSMTEIYSNLINANKVKAINSIPNLEM